MVVDEVIGGFASRLSVSDQDSRLSTIVDVYDGGKNNQRTQTSLLTEKMSRGFHHRSVARRVSVNDSAW